MARQRTRETMHLRVVDEPVQWLTPKDVAALTNLSVRTVRDLVVRGALEGYRVNDSLRSPMRIPREALIRWQQSRPGASI